MRAFLAIILATVLSGCATVFGVDAGKLDSANKQLAAATVQVEALALLTTDLLAADVITPSQARAVSTNLRTALEAIQTAKNAVAASGDPSQADTALEIAARSIDITLRLLQSFAPTQTALLEREHHDSGGNCENSFGRAHCFASA